MAGKKITDDIKKQLMTAPVEVIKNKTFTQLYDGDTKKTPGKEVSPAYKGKSVLPLKKTDKGVKIDAGTKEIAEFVKTSNKVKGLINTINFDTLGDDINSFNKNIIPNQTYYNGKSLNSDLQTIVSACVTILKRCEENVLVNTSLTLEKVGFENIHN